MKFTKTVLSISAAAALMALAGCGSPAPAGTSPAAPLSSAASSGPAVSTPATTSRSAAAVPSSPVAVSPSSTAGAAAVIRIKDFKYQGPASVSPGMKITVMNQDAEAHTITADTGKAFDVMAQVGTTEFTAPKKPGTYAYHCAYHGNMQGILVVK